MERPKSPMLALSWSDRAVAGFVAGLVCGIGLSTAAALYITNSPVPFVNKVQRPTENVNPAAGGQLPDPNKPLYSNRSAVAVPSPDQPRDAAAPAAVEKAPAAAAATAPAAAAPAAADTGGRLMLQTGAFKSPQDADAMRARLALLGLDARVTTVTQDATTLYRVRIGPYRELDDLSGIRRTLSENGIEAQVVRNP
jgi:cell division protein FtsN